MSHYNFNSCWTNLMETKYTITLLKDKKWSPHNMSPQPRTTTNLNFTNSIENHHFYPICITIQSIKVFQNSIKNHMQNFLCQKNWLINICGEVSFHLEIDNEPVLELGKKIQLSSISCIHVNGFNTHLLQIGASYSRFGLRNWWTFDLRVMVG